MANTHRIALLDPSLHDTSTFDCGVDSLNIWLREHATTQSKRNITRTWVLVDQSKTVNGYYALAAHKISRDVVPSKLARGGPREIPAVLVAKLAVQQGTQSKGLGRLMIADALRRIVLVAENVGTRYVVTDAIDECAARWYESLGFVRKPNQLTLVQPITTIAAAFADALAPSSEAS